MRHLQDLYGLNPNIPHMAFQFPRLPPGLTHPLSPVHQNQMKPQLAQHNETLNQKTPKTQLDSNSNSKYAATIAILCLVSLIGIFLIYSLFFI